MNFKTEFKKGQEGRNKGLPMGEGLENISQALNGIQRGMSYGVAAPPKVGKSTFVDEGFILGPYKYWLKSPFNIVWIYLSYEIDRVSKEFDFCTYFLYNEHNIEKIQLPDGVYFEDKMGKIVNWVYLSSDYLRGRLQDTEKRPILIDPYVKEKMIKVYEERIVPLFGEYDENGFQIKKGLMIFHGEADNPTGIYNMLTEIASQRGQFIYQNYQNKEGETKQKKIGYKPNDPDEYVIVITDTVRKLKRERGFTLKENIDKHLEFTTILRNLCNYTFINIVHSNRDLADANKMKQMGEYIHVTPEQIKDSGNISEESSHIITLFNPTDTRYNLEKHFGITIRDKAQNLLYPNLRTVHLVESRFTEAPRHFALSMLGHVKTFKQFIQV